MAPIRRVVLDVLKPHDPELAEVARHAADVEGVDGVNTTLVEIDHEVQNCKLTVEGEAVDYDGLLEAVENLGASVHSVDQVVCGTRMVEDRPTPQD